MCCTKVRRAGVVHDDVQPAEFRPAALDHCSHLPVVGHIAGQGDRLHSLFAGIQSGLVGITDRARVVDRDVKTAISKLQRCGSTHAGSAARDQRHSLSTFCHNIPFRMKTTIVSLRVLTRKEKPWRSAHGRMTRI